MHHKSEFTSKKNTKFEINVKSAEKQEIEQDSININSHHMNPSQILIENQDANVDNLIKISERTSNQVLKNKINNFGMPK